MAQAKQGDTVKVHYTGKLPDDTVFDSSREREPLSFTLGSGQLIPGFEEAVVGMEPGQEKTTLVTADKGYGEHRTDLVFEVERSEFPADINPETGQFLQIQQPDGNVLVVAVRDVSEAAVVLDANHPLAGRDLTFDIELIEID